METKLLGLSGWDDVVFERRNKGYGAYALRRLYLRRLVTGLGASTAIVALMVVAPRLFPPAAPGTVEVLKQVRPELYPPPIIPPKERRDPMSQKPKPRTAITSKITVLTTPVDQPADLFPPDESVRHDGDVEGVPEVGTAVDEPVTIASNNEIHNHAQVMPAYEGGTAAMIRYLSRHLRYPKVPERSKVEGTVYVSFVVNGDGTLSMVEVIKGVHPDLDKEAVRVISSLPGWKGGMQNGIPVRVRMVLPVRFRLRE